MSRILNSLRWALVCIGMVYGAFAGIHVSVFVMGQLGPPPAFSFAVFGDIFVIFIVIPAFSLASGYLVVRLTKWMSR